jgi:hypothetical protein
MEQKCKLRYCIKGELPHTHLCRICLQVNSNHKTFYCPTIKGFRCGATGCVEEHSSHYCRSCGKQDSDHISENCPNPYLVNTTNGSACKAFSKGCSDKHSTHLCKICRNFDSDHTSRNCKEGIIMYHQTDLEHCKNIIRESKFRKGTAGIVGPAIYLSSKPEHTTEKAWRRGWIIKVVIPSFLGKNAVCKIINMSPKGDPKLSSDKVDSRSIVVVEREPLKPNIYAIYEPDIISIINAKSVNDVKN